MAGAAMVAGESAGIFIVSDRSISGGFAIAARGGNTVERHGGATSSPARDQSRGCAGDV
jgi:hypothetical protein